MMDKEDFKYKDRLIKGITQDDHFKVSVVKTTDVIKTARQKHHLSLLNTVLLGRALTGAMLMASELKGEERIQLRLEGNGPVGMLVAEANRVGEIRGYAQHPGAELDYSKKDQSIGNGLGIGIMTFSKTLYNESNPRTSTVKLVKGDVTADLAHFMVQSEQVPSAVMLDVGIDDSGQVGEAGGVLIQRLPDAPDGKIDELQKNLEELKSINLLLRNDYYIDDIMHMAVSPLSARELDRQPVDFFCRCTRKRFKNALAMVSYEELKEMRNEGQELVCHYCNERYNITSEEIDTIIDNAKAKLN